VAVSSSVRSLIATIDDAPSFDVHVDNVSEAAYEKLQGHCVV
jgi:hypothetical protein